MLIQKKKEELKPMGIPNNLIKFKSSELETRKQDFFSFHL